MAEKRTRLLFVPKITLIGANNSAALTHDKRNSADASRIYLS